MPISTSDIRAGDLLLFHGDSFVSWAIRKIDGSEVNHVAIALSNSDLAEAAGSGLQRRAIPNTFSPKDYMIVRRHLTTEPVGPVVDVANTYLANHNLYAYQQIVLLAVLGLTRRIPARGLARRMIRSALDHASRALMDLLPVGASWMICSEYVYRCFDEAAATTPDPFAVEIAGISYGAALSLEPTWLDWAEAEAAKVSLEAPSTFGPVAFNADAAEAELAPLIADWAQYAGIDEDDPLPVSVTFSAPAMDLAAAQESQSSVSDEALQASIVQFAETFKVARESAPGVGVEFGLVPGVITATAVKGAIQGLRDLSVDPNFVTPRDLLESRSFNAPQRAQ